MDANAVYAHLVTDHLGARKSLYGNHRYPSYPLPLTHPRDAPAAQDCVLDTSTPSMCQTLNYGTQSRTCLFDFLKTRGFSSGNVGHRQRVESTQQGGNLRDSVEPLVGENEAALNSPLNPVCSTQAKSGGVAAARRPRITLIGLMMALEDISC